MQVLQACLVVVAHAIAAQDAPAQQGVGFECEPCQRLIAGGVAIHAFVAAVAVSQPAHLADEFVAGREAVAEFHL